MALAPRIGLGCGYGIYKFGEMVGFSDASAGSGVTELSPLTSSAILLGRMALTGRRDIGTALSEN